MVYQQNFGRASSRSRHSAYVDTGSSAGNPAEPPKSSQMEDSTKEALLQCMVELEERLQSIDNRLLKLSETNEAKFLEFFGMIDEIRKAI